MIKHKQILYDFSNFIIKLDNQAESKLGRSFFINEIKKTYAG